MHFSPVLLRRSLNWGNAAIFACLMVAGLGVVPALAAELPAPVVVPVMEPMSTAEAGIPAVGARRADFRGEAVSADAKELADWVMQSADNGNKPFIVIDKIQARVFVFQPDGQLRGATTALMGLAIGDDSVPGIGQRKLSTIRPDERTTPAGRFVASLDRDAHGHEVLWVDYEASVSLHKVVQGTAKERRAQRLASPSAADKRITFGCINVPPRFYDDVVSASFKGIEGIVYVLPETRPARQVFGFYAVENRVQVLGATNAPTGTR